MKAISPVVATILLIGITIAAVVGVWMLVSHSAKPGTVVKLDIVSAEAKAAPGGKPCSFTVVLRNSGTVQVTDVTVKVMTTDGSTSTSITLSPSATTMTPGTTAEFTGEDTQHTYQDGQALKIVITYKGPDGVQRTITDYMTVHVSSY